MANQLVQEFIQRMQKKHDETSVDYWRKGFQMCKAAGSKHLATYGETEVEELVHYLDGLAEQAGLHVQTSYIIKAQATSLHRRYDTQLRAQQHVFDVIIQAGATEIDLQKGGETHAEI